MINKIKYRIIFIFVLAAFTSCQNDDVVTSSVDSMVSESGNLVNQTLPLQKVRVEGEGLMGLKKITLDNKIDVSFNPNYNSDKAFIFTIPFDEKLGSRFGVQPITFVTANGTVNKSIEILHPMPTIEKTVPTAATPGFPLEIEGTWFYDVSSVTVAGKEVSYVVKSSTAIIFGVPADTASGSELVITTPGGSVKKIIDFLTIINVSDFDGGGVRSGWYSYGDVGSFDANTAGGPTGKYATYTWSGSTTNGYNASSSGSGNAFLSATSKDINRASILIDVNANVKDAYLSIQLNTINSEDYAYNIMIEELGWNTLTIKLADFKRNYGYGVISAEADTPLDVSQIKEIKIGVVQDKTPNPTIIKFDNIKVKYE